LILLGFTDILEKYMLSSASNGSTDMTYWVDMGVYDIP